MLAAQVALDVGGTVDVVQAVLIGLGKLHLPRGRVVARMVHGWAKSPGTTRHDPGRLAQDERLRYRRVVLECTGAGT